MKNKYQRLSREDKKEAKKRYIASSDRNKSYMSLLTRMLVLGIIGLTYGIISAIFDAFILSVPVWSYVVDGVIIVFSVFLLVQKGRIQSSTINKFLIKETKGVPVKEEKVEKKIEVKEDKKEEPKKEVKEEKKEVKSAKKAAPKKATRKVEETTEEPKLKKEKAEPKKVEGKEEEIEMPQPKAKKRKHVSKNSKAKKAAKKKSK